MLKYPQLTNKYYPEHKTKSDPMYRNDSYDDDRYEEPEFNQQKPQSGVQLEQDVEQMEIRNSRPQMIKQNSKPSEKGSIVASQRNIVNQTSGISGPVDSRMNLPPPLPNQDMPSKVPKPPHIKSKDQWIRAEAPVNRESRIQYVPFERKVIEYEEQPVTKKVPKKKIVTEYREEMREQLVPREVVEKDYYAVEYIKGYMAQEIPERTVRMVQKRVPYKRIQYVPVTRQVVHPQVYDGYGGQYHHQFQHGYQNYPGYPGHPGFYPATQPTQPRFYSDDLYYPNSHEYHSHHGQIHQHNLIHPAEQRNSLPNPGVYYSSQNQGRGGFYEMNSRSNTLMRSRKNHDLYDHYETYIPSFRY